MTFAGRFSSFLSSFSKGKKRDHLLLKTLHTVRHMMQYITESKEQLFELSDLITLRSPILSSIIPKDVNLLSSVVEWELQTSSTEND